MPTKAKLRPLARSRVVAAIYEVAGEGDRWPTLAELAYHLKVPPVEVHERLNELIVARLFRERQVDNRRVWVPWEQI